MIDEPSEAAPTGFFGRVWAAVRGFKTFAAALVVVLSGMLDQYQLIDLLAMIKSLFGESARIGVILVGVAVVFILLRMATNTPVFGLGKKEGES